jgi:hypothetical protein
MKREIERPHVRSRTPFLRTAVSIYLTSGQFSPETQRLFMLAQSQARFHFGAEVERYLEALRRDIIAGHLFDRFASRPNANVEDQIARLDRINAFYGEFDRMVIPYMRVDQRMPLWWWSNMSGACRRALQMGLRLFMGSSKR